MDNKFKEEVLRKLASLDKKVDANQAYTDDRFNENERETTEG